MDQFLVAEIKPAIGHDRVRPDFASGRAKRRLRIELEPAFLIPTFRRSFDQRDLALVFTDAVEHSVGVGDCAFAQFLLLEPDLLAGLEVLTDPANAVAMSIKMVADEDDTSVMVGHHFILVNYAHHVSWFGRQQDALESIGGRIHAMIHFPDTDLYIST